MLETECVVQYFVDGAASRRVDSTEPFDETAGRYSSHLFYLKRRLGG